MTETPADPGVTYFNDTFNKWLRSSIPGILEQMERMVKNKLETACLEAIGLDTWGHAKEKSFIHTIAKERFEREAREKVDEVAGKVLDKFLNKKFLTGLAEEYARQYRYAFDSAISDRIKAKAIEDADLAFNKLKGAGPIFSIEKTDPADRETFQADKLGKMVLNKIAEAMFASIEAREAREEAERLAREAKEKEKEKEGVLTPAS